MVVNPKPSKKDAETKVHKALNQMMIKSAERERAEGNYYWAIIFCRTNWC